MRPPIIDYLYCSVLYFDPSFLLWSVSMDALAQRWTTLTLTPNGAVYGGLLTFPSSKCQTMEKIPQFRKAHTTIVYFCFKIAKPSAEDDSSSKFVDSKMLLKSHFV